MHEALDNEKPTSPSPTSTAGSAHGHWSDDPSHHGHAASDLEMDRGDSYLGFGGRLSLATLFSVVVGIVGVAGVWTTIGLVDGPSEPLRVAMNSWPGCEFATIAQEKGYFEQEGVEVALLDFQSQEDSRKAFERGETEGFFGTVTQTLLSRQESQRRPQVSLVVDVSNGAHVILATRGIESVDQLRGKKVAVETGSTNHIVLARALELAGIDHGEVEAVPMSSMSIPQAMAQGEIDAVVICGSCPHSIWHSIDATTIFSTRDMPGEMLDVLAFDESIVKSRSNDIQAFARAFYRAQEFSRQHPEEAYRIMANRQKATPEEFLAAFTNGIQLVSSEGQAAFLGSNGTLPSVVAMTERALRSTTPTTLDASGKAIADADNE